MLNLGAQSVSMIIKCQNDLFSNAVVYHRMTSAILFLGCDINIEHSFSHEKLFFWSGKKKENRSHYGKCVEHYGNQQTWDLISWHHTSKLWQKLTVCAHLCLSIRSPKGTVFNADVLYYAQRKMLDSPLCWYRHYYKCSHWWRSVKVK